ncbi:MAG: helix-turn-helix transcriptional regulator [Lachnospiraceae bacterium]|nr:helix-turn-helix transcriptional regulator [Lachnospiraceae bacterium]
MEFKDKLKKIRSEHGISQQALADAIFVSRSAIAKWESGLGYPNEASMSALLEYFEVDKGYFETEEVENIIVEKNKDISILKTIILCVATIGLLVISMILPLAISSGNYGFTSKMAAGKHYEDEACISLEDYDIYWYTITEPEEYARIDGFRPVKKMFYGYVVDEADYKYKEVYCDGEKVALLYSIAGKAGYYNILRHVGTIIGWEENGSLGVSYFAPLWLISQMQINGKTYEVQYNSFFITEEPVTEFSIGEYDFEIH